MGVGWGWGTSRGWGRGWGRGVPSWVGGGVSPPYGLPERLPVTLCAILSPPRGSPAPVLRVTPSVMPAVMPSPLGSCLPLPCGHALPYPSPPVGSPLGRAFGRAFGRPLTWGRVWVAPCACPLPLCAPLWGRSRLRLPALSVGSLCGHLCPLHLGWVPSHAPHALGSPLPPLWVALPLFAPLLPCEFALRSCLPPRGGCGCVMGSPVRVGRPC